MQTSLMPKENGLIIIQEKQLSISTVCLSVVFAFFCVCVCLGPFVGKQVGQLLC